MKKDNFDDEWIKHEAEEMEKEWRKYEAEEMEKALEKFGAEIAERFSNELLRKKEDLEPSIGHILSSCIYIEQLLDSLITNHFVFDEKKEQFIHVVLDDGGFNFMMKFKICKRLKLFDTCYKGFKKDLLRLMDIRNQVAHSRQQITAKKVEIYDRKKGLIDILDLHKEFITLYSKVAPELYIKTK